jgi:hypothetical protein
MTAEECVMTYAAAFEETYRDDDWTRLERFFADDARYEVRGGPMACSIEGRDAIFRGIKKSLDGLDRRSDARRITLLSGPETHAEADGDCVTLRWEVGYDFPGGRPPVRFAGETAATVANERIVRLVDSYTDADADAIADWLDAHGEGLDASYV